MAGLRCSSPTALFLALSIIVFTLTTTGCNERDEEIGTDQTILPLTAGNQWTYQIYTTAGDGSFTMTVGDTLEMDGNTVWEIDYSGFYYGEDYWVLLANLDTGLYFFGDAVYGESHPPDPWCPVTAEEGYSWETAGQGLPLFWEVISTSETVTVPAGTFTW